MTRTRTIVAILGLALVAGALSGCGKQGDLDRPAPLWGEKAKADWAAQQRAAAAARHAQPTNSTPEPLPEDTPPPPAPDSVLR